MSAEPNKSVECGVEIKESHVMYRGHSVVCMRESGFEVVSAQQESAA